MADAGFWNAQERAREVVQEVKVLKNWIEPFDALLGRIRSARELEELLCVEPDAEMEAEVARETAAIHEELAAFELRSLLQGKDDFRDAQLEISAGAGGTEAQDWAQMLMRMYTRWAERKGYQVEILDLSEGEEAGIKGAVLEIKRSLRVRVPASGDGRAPAGAHLALRLAGAAAHELRVGVRVSGGERGDQHRDPRGGPADRRLPRVRRGGAARQQDELGGAYHAPPLGHGGGVAGGAEQFKNKATAMKQLKNRLYQIEADKQAAVKAALDATKSGRLVRQPDPQLRVPAVHDGQRPPHGAQDHGRAEGDGWRHRPVHRGVPEAVRGPGGAAHDEDLNFVIRDGAAREARGAGGVGRAAVRVRLRPVARVRGRRAAPRRGRGGAGGAGRGRVVAWRGHGKTIFAHLADDTGRVQLYFRKDQLGDETFARLAHFDLGDVIGVQGRSSARARGR
jgi:peptide chain release factor 2